MTDRVLMHTFVYLSADQLLSRMQLNTDTATGTETISAPMTDKKEVVTVTRRLLVQIKGSMDHFNRTGIEAATWSPISGKTGEIFGVNEVFETTPDVGMAAAALQSAHIHKITVLEQKNDFPVHLGVNISCITPEETTRTGHRYAMTSLASSHTQFPLVIFEAGEQTEGIEWRQKYPQFNANNLDKHGVLEVSGAQFIFCSQIHPVIELLRQNKEMLNADIDTQPLSDGEWYKITRQVFSTCCNTLKTKVLSKVSTRDLNNFSLQITRVGRDDWTNNIQQNDEIMSLVSSNVMAAGEQAITDEVSGILKRNYTYSTRLEIQYDMHV